MADIENPLATSSSVATSPDRSRHSFWAWKERFVILWLGADDDPNDEPFDGVKMADADQRSRLIFLWWSTLIDFLLLIGSTLLMIYVHPSTAGHAVFVASRVLGHGGQAAAVCWGYLLAVLWDAVATGDRNDQRMIDSLM
jgi:hypothetical protein